MPDFFIAYRGGKPPSSPEEGEVMMKAWNQWLADLGEAMINPGNPTRPSIFMSDQGEISHEGQNPTMGYSVLRASSLEEAKKAVALCPFLSTGGTIELAELFDL